MRAKSKERHITLPATVAGLLLILVISGVYFVYYLQQQIYEERTDQLTEITSQVDTNLNNELSTHWNYLSFAVNMLEGYDLDTIQDTAAYIGVLERVLEMESLSSRLILLDSQGNCYDTSGNRGVWSDVDVLASVDERYAFISDSYIHQGSYWNFVQKLGTPIHTREDDVSFTHLRHC